jgi:hypothetical protein
MFECRSTASDANARCVFADDSRWLNVCSFAIVFGSIPFACCCLKLHR